MVRLATTTLLVLLVLAAPAAANQPPEILSASVTPSTLPYVGGTVAVTAQVADFEGAVVGSVDVEVTGGTSSPFMVPLSPGSGYEWSGMVELPANLAPEPSTWQFRIVARDLDFAETFASAGAVEVAGYPGFDDPPVVSDPSVTPRVLPSGGGPVTLAVTASDPTGIREVFALVTGPAGGMNVALQPLGDDRYQGVFDAPANAGTAPVEYTVKLIAVDPLGQMSDVDAGAFRVASIRPTGRLEITRGALAFGPTKVGKRKQHSLVLRNRGARSTAPVEGVITTSGAPFSIPGAPATGLPFCLRGGEKLKVAVEFRPTAAGVRSGTLMITRGDGVQPPLTVALTGVGTTRSHVSPASQAASGPLGAGRSG